MLLSISATAAVLQCHEETLRRWIREGKCKALHLPGGQALSLSTLGIPAEEVEALEAEWRAAMQAAALKELGA